MGSLTQLTGLGINALERNLSVLGKTEDAYLPLQATTNSTSTFSRYSRNLSHRYTKLYIRMFITVLSVTAKYW